MREGIESGKVWASLRTLAKKAVYVFRTPPEWNAAAP
jgi:hypothetical protein